MDTNGALFDLEYYRTIVENMHEGVAICRMLFDEEGKSADYNILWVNRNFQDRTGLKKEDILGKNAKEIYEYDLNEFLETCTEVIKTGEPAQLEISSKTLDRFFIVQVMLLGKGDVFAIVCNDITKREEIKNSLVESESRAYLLVKKLKESNRNKNMLINTLSHELRNPLAVISAGLETLEVSKDLDGVKRIKGIVGRQIKQLNSLADDLLAIARITSNKIELKKERIELKSLMLLLTEEQQPLFSEKGISLEAVFADNIYVEADYVRLKQIIENLLDNARKYTPAGGKVFVEAKKDFKEAVIKVRDSGIGLDSNLISQLFQPFVQSDRFYDKEEKGLGLGLSIAKDLAKLHGGTIDAYSEGKGKGSEFSIRLPLLAIDSVEKTEKVEPKESVGPSLSILVIEDNEVLAELLCELVNMAGHSGQIANNGSDGIDVARSLNPDIIFCDIGLPGMSGLEVAKAIRADSKLKDTLLVAMTGYGAENDIRKTKERGFDRHLTKPVSFETLRQLFDEILKRY